MTNFSEDTAVKIVQSKLAGKPPSAVYELSDAELSLLRDYMERWTIGMGQVLAERIGDSDKTQELITDTLKLSSTRRVKLAKRAGAALDRGEIPDHQEFAAFILANHSDQIHVEDEIARRERLN